MEKYFGSKELTVERLEELGWKRENFMSSTFEKGDYLLTTHNKIGGGYDKVTLKIKDNVNGVYLMRGIEDKYKTIYENTILTEKQLKRLTKSKIYYGSISKETLQNLGWKFEESSYKMTKDKFTLEGYIDCSNGKFPISKAILYVKENENNIAIWNGNLIEEKLKNLIEQYGK